MRYQHFAAALVLLVCAVSGCKKEKDERAPVVTIISPSEGFHLALPDTLTVVADVSGERKVDRVSITISSANGVPVAEPLIVVPSGNPVRLEVGIPIISDLIASGDHTLTVQAVSGDVSGKDRAGIVISGTPLRLRRVLVVGQPDVSTVSLHIIDSTGAVSTANSLVMDLGGAAVSSAARTFVVAGTVQGPLIAFGPDAMEVPWQKPNLGNSGIPWFTSLDLCSDGRYYVGSTNAQLLGYNARTGATERVINISNGYRSKTTCIVDERLLDAEVDQTGSLWRVGVYQASSGALVSEQAIGQSVVAAFPRGGAHALLFGNNAGLGVVRDHHLEAGGGWEPYVWNAGITAVERINTNTFLLAMTDGKLERFTYSNTGSVTIATIPEMRDLAIDASSGLVFIAAGPEVKLIDPQNGQLLASWPIGLPVHAVLPLLNR